MIRRGDAKARCAILAVRSLQAAVLWCASLSAMPTCDASNNVEPEQVRDVQLGIEGTMRTIRMVRVPAASDGVTDSETSVPDEGKITQPFFFALTELSLADFNALASADIQKSHEGREQSMAPHAEQKKDWSEMQQAADEYVAKMVSLDEASAITAAATAALAKPSGRSSASLVSERFRLPTAAEWRHAMSMGSQPKHRYINPWPVLERDFSEKERGRCAELWGACGGDGAFVGSPEQVLWLIQDAYGNSEQRLELLTTFTRFLLQGRRLDPNKANSYSWEVQPEPLAERIDAAPGNEWGMRGAHRGYPEWVLSVTSQSEALAFWRRCESANRTDADRQRTAFSLCGASSFTLNKDDIKPMLQAFVFYEPSIVNGKSSFSWQEAEDSDVCVDRSVSVRLVLIECLADEWVASVRTSCADEKDAASAAENAKPLLAEITRLTSGSERDRNEAIVNIYVAIAEYRCGAMTEGASRLAENAVRASGQSRSADDIAARLRRAQGNAGATSPQRRDPNAIYLQSVARLMAHDAEPGSRD